MNPISNKWSWKFQKNKHLLESLLLRNAPEFVYKSAAVPINGEIPVFTYHIALPESFEENCLYLAENGYKTLSADEFLYSLTKVKLDVKKSILLTFDDGLKQVWTVVYPILKKYNLKATCFLIPGCIPENDKRIRPNLEDYWRGQASRKEIISFGSNEPALATWEEIKIMHESGVIDFQSHTMYHSLVHTSEEIFDFINPEYNTHFYGNIHVPLYVINNEEITSRDPIMGMPVYYSKPRMTAAARYYDDEYIRSLCIETVKARGSKEFFKKKNWRKILHRVISDYKKKNKIQERYETPEERDKVVAEELRTSREMIEEKLAGKDVVHLCYPWYDAEDFALEASKITGFKVNYFGQIRGKPTNRPGDDPFHVVRIEETFLQRLPGSGRKKLSEIFKHHYELRRLPALLKGSKETAL